MSNKLSDWINEELNERGWSLNELARRADLSPATIGDVVMGKTNPGLKLCLGLSRAFGVPGDYVLRLAGHLPPLPGPEPSDSFIKELFEIVRALTKDKQDLLLRLALDFYHDESSKPLQLPNLEKLERAVEEVVKSRSKSSRSKKPGAANQPAEETSS